MNEKLSQIASQLGANLDTDGELLEKFGRKIIDECIVAVQNTNKHHAYTTFDLGMVESTIEKSVVAILDRFKL